MDNDRFLHRTRASNHQLMRTSILTKASMEVLATSAVLSSPSQSTTSKGAPDNKSRLEACTSAEIANTTSNQFYIESHR